MFVAGSRARNRAGNRGVEIRVVSAVPCGAWGPLFRFRRSVPQDAQRSAPLGSRATAGYCQRGPRRKRLDRAGQTSLCRPAGARRFLTFFPGLPPWARLFCAYGAEHRPIEKARFPLSEPYWSYCQPSPAGTGEWLRQRFVGRTSRPRKARGMHTSPRRKGRTWQNILNSL